MLVHLRSASVPNTILSTASDFLVRVRPTARGAELQYNFLPVTFQRINQKFTMFSEKSASPTLPDMTARRP